MLFYQEKSHAEWISGLCIGIPVLDLEFDLRHKSVVSHSFFLYWPVFDHSTVNTWVCILLC